MNCRNSWTSFATKNVYNNNQRNICSLRCQPTRMVYELIEQLHFFVRKLLFRTMVIGCFLGVCHRLQQWLYERSVNIHSICWSVTKKLSSIDRIWKNNLPEIRVRPCTLTYKVEQLWNPGLSAYTFSNTLKHANYSITEANRQADLTTTTVRFVVALVEPQLSPQTMFKKGKVGWPGVGLLLYVA